MKTHDLVIFDCDGVVVDSEMLSCQCLADALTGVGIEIGVDEVIERFLGRGFAAVADYCRSFRGRDLPDDFQGDLRRRLAEAFVTSLRPMPHVRDVLESLDVPYCLASSSEPARIGVALAVTALDGYFTDRVYHAGMVERAKPAPDLFLLAANEMAVSPSNTLVIEDSVPGVLAGKAAGMTVWGFTGGSHCKGGDVGRRLVEAGADRIVASMADLLDG